MPDESPAKKPFRWAAVLGWLLVFGSLGLSLMAITGSKSEQQLIDASLYTVMPFGFGAGVLFGTRALRSSIRTRYPAVALLVYALIGTAAVAFARWYFFEKVFYRL